jgi:hypothetical protein
VLGNSHSREDADDNEENNKDQSQGRRENDIDIQEPNTSDGHTYTMEGGLNAQENNAIPLEHTESKDRVTNPLALQLDRDAIRVNILRSLPPDLAKEVADFIDRPHFVKREADWRKPEFEKFSDQEASLSKKSREHLVQPSGDHTSHLAIRLNYPTFTV